jgi:hypothetical protein
VQRHLATVAVYGLIAVGFGGLAGWLLTSSDATWDGAGRPVRRTPA